MNRDILEQDPCNTCGYEEGSIYCKEHCPHEAKIEQDPKTGHWILDDDKEHGRCSECGCKEDLVDGHSSYKWCSNCGAKMEVEV